MEGLPADRAARVGERRSRRRRRGRALSAAGRRIVVWRHGRTAWNAERRFQGQTDVPLDDAGVAQAERAARLLASLRPDAIVASDLRRAADTAAPLAGLTGLPVRPDARLRERHGGEWQGLTGEQLAARFPTEYGAWRRGEPVVPVGGEGYATVADRATAALAAALAPLPDDGTLVVVTHGGTARAAIGRLLGLPERAWSALGPLANCAWSALGQQGSGWRLLEHNAGTLPEAVLSDDS